MLRWWYTKGRATELVKAVKKKQSIRSNNYYKTLLQIYIELLTYGKKKIKIKTHVVI